MTALGEPQIDGRNARRERNVNHVLDVVMAMFAEDALFPTMEQVADRSGLSLRSLYRYFPDPAALVHASIERHSAMVDETAHLPSIGEGPLGARIDDFVTMRVDVYERFGPLFRAALANASRHQVIASAIAKRRGQMRSQLERQFEPELAQLGELRDATVDACQILCGIDAAHVMALEGRSPEQAKRAMATGLRALLSS